MCQLRYFENRSIFDEVEGFSESQHAVHVYAQTHLLKQFSTTVYLPGTCFSWWVHRGSSRAARRWCRCDSGMWTCPASGPRSPLHQGPACAGAPVCVSLPAPADETASHCAPSWERCSSYLGGRKPSPPARSCPSPACAAPATPWRHKDAVMGKSSSINTRGALSHSCDWCERCCYPFSRSWASTECKHS